MPKKLTDPFSTCDTMAAVNYQCATGVRVNLQANTSPPGDQVRTVVTTAQKGALDLRYAPRSPKVSDKNTAL
jgi:hypothetical protein